MTIYLSEPIQIMLHLQQFSPNLNKEATEQVIEVDIISFLQLYVSLSHFNSKDLFHLTTSLCLRVAEA